MKTEDIMNEEEYIREKMGTRNPFTVPEGYFDRLAEQIIDRLPADNVRTDSHISPKLTAVGANDPVRPRPAIIRYLRPLLYAAACVVLAVAVGIVFRNSANVTPEQYVAQHQETSTTDSDNYLDDMADYAMLDNEDIYASLLADL